MRYDIEIPLNLNFPNFAKHTRTKLLSHIITDTRNRTQVKL